jgi:glycine/D-amino acid oxidase-like deaminating enzyme
LLILSDAVLYPPCAAGYFVRRAQDREADLYLGKEVVTAGGGRVRLNDGTELSSPRIVNAAGAVASAITGGLLIRKRKGHLVITDRYPDFVRHQLVELGYLKSAHSLEEDSVAFNVQPRRTGQILIGSSRQYAGESTDVDPCIFSAMLDRATSYMRSISFLSALRIWTGFRAATPDKLPLIGPLPEDPTLFVATGHEGLGITTSLVSAGQTQKARALLHKRRRHLRFAARLKRAFTLRPELKHLAREDTILCRCEDVRWGAVARHSSWRSAKLHTRCGMGPCQGRICGAATEFLLDWGADSPRPPIFPAMLANLAALCVTAENQPFELKETT